MDDTNTSTESEWWWIDYLENELDASLDADLKMLLDTCEADRVSFEQFRLLKQWVKESDPVVAWPVDERLKRVRQNVMDAIQNEEPWTEERLTVSTKSLRV